MRHSKLSETTFCGPSDGVLGKRGVRQDLCEGTVAVCGYGFYMLMKYM